MTEKNCEMVFAVVYPTFADPVKHRYKIARRMAKVLQLSFGKKIQVHIGTRDGNEVKWTDDVWPKGEQ